MKHLLAIFFVLSLGNFFSQKINASAVCDSTVRNLLDEFSENRIYTLEEARETGIQKADCDLANGTKKIIVYIGMFTSNYCQQCFYSDLGFIIEEQVSSDVIYESDYSYEFANGYNNQMNSLLDSVQLSELKNLSSGTGSDLFIFDAIRDSHFTGSKINDTLIRLQLKNKELENLFPSDLANIKVTIKIAHDNTSGKVYSYSELMADGVLFPFPTLIKSEINVGYNFEEVPDRMKICWCKLIEREFQQSIRITFK